MSSNSVKLDSAKKCYRRFGYLSHANVVRNAPETVREFDNVCNVCALAKITKTSVPRLAETRAEEKLERVFIDVVGLFRVEPSGFWFCIVFADQYTEFLFVDLLKAKSESLASLKKIVFSVGTPKKVRQHNAKGILSEQFKMFCLDASILQEKTIPATPQQNGLAESRSNSLLEMARCLLIESGLPKMIWGAAITHATRTGNLVVRQGEEKCPAEQKRGIKPKLSISKLLFLVAQSSWGSGTEMSANMNPRHWKKIFGLHRRRQRIPGVRTQHTQGYGSSRWDHQGVRSRLNPWQHRDARPTIWGVTATWDPALRWWSSRLWQERVAGHIYCNEGGRAWCREREHSRNDTETRCLRCWGSSTGWRIYGNMRDSKRLWSTARQWKGELRTVRDSWFLWRGVEQADRAELRRGTRARNIPHFLKEVRTHLAVTEVDYVEPKTVYEAKHGDDWDQWNRAMLGEFKALQDNETWNQIRPPTDRDVILANRCTKWNWDTVVKWTYKKHAM